MVTLMFPEEYFAPSALADDEESTDERWTPESVLSVVRAYGPIAIDPCSTPDNRTNAPVHCYRGGPQCGLRATWYTHTIGGGIAWVNPPYSRGNIAAWANKCVSEARLGATIIALVTADLSTQWGTVLFRQANALAFWRGRIAFVKRDGQFESGHNKPSLFAYFGDGSTRFQRVFAPHANVVVRGGWE